MNYKRVVNVVDCRMGGLQASQKRSEATGYGAFPVDREDSSMATATHITTQLAGLITAALEDVRTARELDDPIEIEMAEENLDRALRAVPRSHAGK